MRTLPESECQTVGIRIRTNCFVKVISRQQKSLLARIEKYKNIVVSFITSMLPYFGLSRVFLLYNNQLMFNIYTHSFVILTLFTLHTGTGTLAYSVNPDFIRVCYIFFRDKKNFDRNASLHRNFDLNTKWTIP